MAQGDADLTVLMSPDDVVRIVKTNLGKMIRAGIMDDQMRRRSE